MFFACLVLCFFIGSVPTAYLLGKYLWKTDIREHGSGNVGATNAYRVYGKRAGFLVLAIDFLKGFIPTFLFAHLVVKDPQPSTVLWLGFGAILGHIFTPFLKFKGGKGVATGSGVLCAASAPLCLTAAGIFAIVFILTRTVSLGSLTAVLFLIPLSALYGLGRKTMLACAVLFIITLWTHRSNISRLVTGSEKRLF